MAETDNTFPEADFIKEFELTSVRVVATLGDDRGAIVENLPKLLCWEGRLQSYESTEDGPLNTLDYHFGFAVLDEADPMASTSLPGRIVITGVHPTGGQLEIRGNGWIGYDEKGNLEGVFDIPPVIITEDQYEAEGDVEAVKSPTYPDFPMPPQFDRAAVRVRQSSSRWSDDDND